MVTTAQLKKLFPYARPELAEAVATGWVTAAAAGIDTPQRIAMFLANIGHETGGLRSVVESLTYTSADRIRKVWPTRFKSAAAAQPFVRQPQKLANKVYNGRMGNRSGSNDGWTYRGSGMMQTTGREGFRTMGFEDNPEGLRDPTVAFASAVAEWAKRGCNAMADAGDVERCRRAINGGTNGLKEVQALYRKGMAIMATPTEPLVTAGSGDVFADLGVPNPYLIEKVQQLLRDRGYPEVGNVDGKMGSRTRNAILAFQADNGQRLTGEVTDALLAELVKAPQRPVSEARATATAKDLKDAPSVRQGEALKQGGILAAGASVVAGVVNGTVSADDIVGHISTARIIYAALGIAAPYAALAIGGAVVAYFGARFVREQVEAYRAGRHV